MTLRAFTRLEYCVESALLAYEPRAGAEVISLATQIGRVSGGFYDSYITDVIYRFLYESGTGKVRFRRLPGLIRSLAEWSPEYRKYESMLEREATKRGCSPDEL